MHTAYANRISDDNGVDFHVGISDERAVNALRDLACRIERKEVSLDKVRVFTFADGNDFTKTALKLVFIEKR